MMGTTWSDVETIRNMTTESFKVSLCHGPSCGVLWTLGLDSYHVHDRVCTRLAAIQVNPRPPFLAIIFSASDAAR